MNVTFTRTAERRYRVSVEGPGVVPAFMEPAPGYDARLPHDLAHFVVEREIGIAGGVFGQLAAGGHANTFHPVGQKPRGRVVERGRRLATANRDDALLSEKIVYVACSVWNQGPAAVASVGDISGVAGDDLRRVCRELDVVSAAWSKLGVGESMTLAWPAKLGQSANRRPRQDGRSRRRYVRSGTTCAT